jgi:hypothetical protein
MWNDIDYMYEYKYAARLTFHFHSFLLTLFSFVRDFTVDPIRFPLNQVKAFTDELHRTCDTLTPSTSLLLLK